jgi:NDP-sugar pyrophosphorylase family protein
LQASSPNTIAVRAFILAAGEGRRLGTLTEHVPKPMIEIRGRPILEHTIKRLSAFGVRDFIVNTHHHSEAIVSYFGDGAAFGVRMTYSYEPALLGTAGALNPVRDLLDSTFLLVYGDNLTTCRLDRLIATHRPGDLATIAVFQREDVAQSGVVELDADDRVTAFVEKPDVAVESHWVNAGLIILEPRIFEFIPPGGFSDFGRTVLPAALEAGERLSAYKMSEQLWWIDSLQDYERTIADPALAALDA